MLWDVARVIFHSMRSEFAGGRGFDSPSTPSFFFVLGYNLLSFVRFPETLLTPPFSEFGW